jgi:hypothetical protein
MIAFILSIFRIREVPASLAACEFDCRETNCTTAKAATCELRLIHERAVTRSSGLRVGAAAGRKARIAR